MSAWSIGADRAEVQKMGRGGDSTSEIIGRVARWIPGDILVLYAGAINSVSAEPAPPSVRLLVVFFIATPVVVLLGAFAKHKVARFDFAKAALAMLAFAIWSLSIPRSGWHQWSLVSDNPAWVTIVSVLGGLMFGLLASGIERTYSTGEYDQT
jgi:hypothetical protein